MQLSGGLVSTEWTEDLVFDQELRHRFGSAIFYSKLLSLISLGPSPLSLSTLLLTNLLDCLAFIVIGLDQKFKVNRL
jgi:hypothetical protein